MSGGAFDYFYYKVDDQLALLTQKLAEMLIVMDADPSRYDPEAAKILNGFGARMTALQEEAKELSDLMHSVEWVASNDYGPDAITDSVKDLFLKGYSMTLRPTLNRVVVTRDEAGGKTEGGILLPDSAKGKSTRGTVVSAGPGRYHDGKFIETTLKTGDKVLFGSYAGTEVELDRKTYLIMDDSEILATLS